MTPRFRRAHSDPVASMSSPTICDSTLFLAGGFGCGVSKHPLYKMSYCRTDTSASEQRGNACVPSGNSSEKTICCTTCTWVVAARDEFEHALASGKLHSRTCGIPHTRRLFPLYACVSCEFSI